MTFSMDLTLMMSSSLLLSIHSTLLSLLCGTCFDATTLLLSLVIVDL